MTGHNRVVVVGGSGNVGTGVLRALRDCPDTEVVGVSRRAPHAVPDWHEIDIGHPRSAPLLDAAFAGADAVVHLAWLLQPSHDVSALHATNVEGSRRVFEAAVRSGVRHLVYMSSIGAYSPSRHDTRQSENWPVGGVGSSTYGRQKAVVEAMLNRVEHENPDLVVSRLRPGLVFQRDAASEIQRYFIGSLVPAAAFRLAANARVPALPLPADLVVQFVHADDLGRAVARVLRDRVPGAFNVAAEPPMTAESLAGLLGGKHLTVPIGLLRGLADLSWRLRLQPTEPGWLDLAVSVPVMNTDRAVRELDWKPEHSAPEAVAELLHGLADGAGGDTPPLAPRVAGEQPGISPT